jgi:glycosyltransferase involved in cell wall biosynthesis
MPLDTALFQKASTLPKAIPHRILFAGNLLPSKGADLLIRALPLLIDWGLECVLRIVGEGSEKAALLRLAQNSGVSHLIQWAGVIPHGAMPEEYGRATVTVLPSRGNSEGLGMVLVESLLAGCPVIGTAGGGIPDVITHGETGLLTNDGDARNIALALRQMLSSPALRARTVSAQASHDVQTCIHHSQFVNLF